MPCIDYGPNGTNTNECGSNGANEYSPRDEVSEDAKQRDAEKNDFSKPVRVIRRMGGVALNATELSPRERATQDELFPESWVTGQ